MERQLYVTARDVAFLDNLAEFAPRRVRIDGGQCQPATLVGEHAVVLLALPEGKDVEHPDGPFLVVDGRAVDDDVVLVQRVAGFLPVVDVAEHVPEHDDERDARLAVWPRVCLDGELLRLALDGPAFRY